MGRDGMVEEGFERYEDLEVVTLVAAALMLILVYEHAVSGTGMRRI